MRMEVSLEPERTGNLGADSAKFLGHGMTFAVSAALFGWIGNKIGVSVGAEVLMTTVGVFLGAGASFYRLYKALNINSGEND
jgi:apolipoprotein N-acyltransferase